MNAAALIFPPLDHPLWYLPVFLLGACIGSFLNVVIHRVPLGLSVNEPKRSFCPKCRKEIPMRLNIPLVSWLMLRGKCANCRAPISFRYFAVELLTAVLFSALWGWTRASLGATDSLEPALAAIVPLWTVAAFFVAITFIDAEHMIIPISLTWIGSALGLVAAALWPRLPDLSGWAATAPLLKDGLIQSAAGWTIGFCGLWLVVLLGKFAFGRKKMVFPEPVAWKLEEGKAEDEPIWFEIGGERTAWWDMFFRKTDRLLVECATLRVNDYEEQPGTLTIREDGIQLPDGRTMKIEDIHALDGTAARAVIPREAMGMGDVHLMGTIGAFFGWTGVFFSLFAASIYAIIAALLGRVGFGMRLPFGPFLILGAFSWLFGGWKFAQWYFEGLRAGF